MIKIARLSLNQPLFEWAKKDPDGLHKAAEGLAKRAETDLKGLIEMAQKKARRDKFDPIGDEKQDRLLAVLLRDPNGTAELFQGRPEALVEAVDILVAHPEEVRRVMTRSAYTDLDSIGGPLDRDIRSELK